MTKPIHYFTAIINFENAFPYQNVMSCTLSYDGQGFKFGIAEVGCTAHSAASQLPALIETT